MKRVKMLKIQVVIPQELTNQLEVEDLEGMATVLLEETPSTEAQLDADFGDQSWYIAAMAAEFQNLEGK